MAEYSANFCIFFWLLHWNLTQISMCVQSHALGTRTKFQLEILIRTMIPAIHKFRENILESSRNVSETPPRWHVEKEVWPASWKWCEIFQRFLLEGRNWQQFGLTPWFSHPEIPKIFALWHLSINYLVCWIQSKCLVSIVSVTSRCQVLSCLELFLLLIVFTHITGASWHDCQLTNIASRSDVQCHYEGFFICKWWRNIFNGLHLVRLSPQKQCYFMFVFYLKHSISEWIHPTGNQSTDEIRDMIQNG